MTSKAPRFFTQVQAAAQAFFDTGQESKVKVLFLAATYFLIIGAYTVAREIKDSIFMAVVGKEYQPTAKLVVIFVLIPVILFYSRLVDRFKKHQLLMLCSAFFGIGSLVIAYFIGHDTIGLLNTHKSPWRMFGWVVYLFGEGYSPFLVSVLWALVNSVTSPEGAKNSYSLIVAASKLGGMLSAGLAWFLFSMSATRQYTFFSDVTSHQCAFFVSSIMLLLTPFVVQYMIRKVPSSQLHGYDAAYEIDTKHEKEVKKHPESGVGLFSGLVLLVKYPYVMGIFSMIFFYEVTSTVVAFLRLGVAQAHGSSIAGTSAILFKIMFMTHFVGLLISLFGTRILLKGLGERFCLMIVPLLIGSLLVGLMAYPTPDVVMLVAVALKAINYAFSWPVRESLYIPTIKDIKFKSRSWIDAFGGKFAKTGGSLVNEVVTKLGESFANMVYSLFFAGVVVCWFFSALFLGKRFEIAVSNNEVIGAEDEKSS